MYFKDRQEAGKKLAEALERYREVHPLVCALPRGGVVLGFEIAHALHAPLDLVIARKVGHPDESEYAICAVTEADDLLCDDAEAERIDPLRLKEAIDRERREARRRREVYLHGKQRASVEGKIVIVVDDGVATGLTLRVALASLRKEHPKKLIVAVPVAPFDVVKILRKEADDVILLDGGEHYLGAIGLYYENFPQVTDEEVVGLLKRVARRSVSGTDDGRE